jgi:hypothetical protein
MDKLFRRHGEVNIKNRGKFFGPQIAGDLKRLLSSTISAQNNIQTVLGNIKDIDAIVVTQRRHKLLKLQHANSIMPK